MSDKSPSYYYENETDIREIIKILIESKKLILLSVLIFTIAASIYFLYQKTEYKSSALIEIGYYITPDGTHKLVEQPSAVISNLKIYQLLNAKDDGKKNTSFTAIENKLIQIETSSISLGLNKEILNQYISKTEERHLNTMNSFIESSREKVINEIDSNYERISLLNSKFGNLKEPDSGYYDLLFKLESEIEHLTHQLDLQDNPLLRKTELIGNIKSIAIKTKFSLIITVGFILGLMAGIFLVFIAYFTKSYREYQK